MKLFAVALLFIAAFSPASAQTPAASEVARLRQEYIDATTGYIGSLRKLKALYEDGAVRQEARVSEMERMNKDGLVSGDEVAGARLALSQTREKVKGVNENLRQAQEELAAVPTTDALITEYGRARAEEARQRKRASAAHKKPAAPCRDWMIESDRRASLGGQSSSPYKFVCSHPNAPRN